MYNFVAPDFPLIVLFIVSFIVLIVFLWALYSFFLAIFQFIFSRWEEAWIKKAWNTIRYTILWVIFCIVLLFVFPIVLQRLNVPWYQFYTAENIFNQVWKILSYVLSFWSWDIWYSPNNSEVLSSPTLNWGL